MKSLFTIIFASALYQYASAVPVFGNARCGSNFQVPDQSIVLEKPQHFIYGQPGPVIHAQPRQLVIERPYQVPIQPKPIPQFILECAKPLIIERPQPQPMLVPRPCPCPRQPVVFERTLPYAQPFLVERLSSQPRPCPKPVLVERPRLQPIIVERPCPQPVIAERPCPPTVVVEEVNPVQVEVHPVVQTLPAPEVVVVEDEVVNPESASNSYTVLNLSMPTPQTVVETVVVESECEPVEETVIVEEQPQIVYLQPQPPCYETSPVVSPIFFQNPTTYQPETVLYQVPFLLQPNAAPSPSVTGLPLRNL